MSRPPLPLADWRARWLVLPNWGRLHRVAEIVYESDWDGISGVGVTVCGRRGYLSLPGVISRMGLARCARCCRALGVPVGNGAPFNQYNKRQEKWKNA